MNEAQPADVGRAARTLHAFIVKNHVRNGALVGPDQGVRWERVAGRLARSALPFLPQRDKYVFYQGLGYWVLANDLLYEVWNQHQFRETALAAASYIADTQRENGSWSYPLPARRHLVATLEGLWAAYACALVYRWTRDERFSVVCEKWREYLENQIGYEQYNAGECVNYFDTPRGLVPNNAAEALWIGEELAVLLNDLRYCAHTDALTEFLRTVQLQSGELPYVVGTHREPGRVHLLCYNYNAFQFIGLCRAYERTQDRTISTILENLAAFLKTGVTDDGAARYSCESDNPHTLYYDAVLGQALMRAGALFPGHGYERLSGMLYGTLLSAQREDGGFDFSEKEYGMLSDTRSYPRNQAMILTALGEKLKHSPAPT